MKTIFLISMSILFSELVKSQEDLHYVLKAPTILQECDINGALGALTSKLVPNGSKFSIVGINGTNYIIKFWEWKLNDPAIATAKTAGTFTSAAYPTGNANKQAEFNYYPAGTNRFFLISTSTLETFATPLVKRTSPSFGAVTLPFKYRPSEKDFTKDVALSSLGGIKWNFSSGKNSLNLLIGIGISSVNVDSSNTEGKVLESQDRAAITLPMGIVYQWEKLQAGFFWGWDWLSKKNEDNWIYQGKTWIGIGIGVSIFSDENLSVTEGKNK